MAKIPVKRTPKFQDKYPSIPDPRTGRAGGQQFGRGYYFEAGGKGIDVNSPLHSMRLNQGWAQMPVEDRVAALYGTVLALKEAVEMIINQRGYIKGLEERIEYLEGRIKTKADT